MSRSVEGWPVGSTDYIWAAGESATRLAADPAVHLNHHTGANCGSVQAVLVAEEDVKPSSGGSGETPSKPSPTSGQTDAGTEENNNSTGVVNNSTVLQETKNCTDENGTSIYCSGAMMSGNSLLSLVYAAVGSVVMAIVLAL